MCVCVCVCSQLSVNKQGRLSSLALVERTVWENKEKSDFKNLKSSGESVTNYLSTYIYIYIYKLAPFPMATTAKCIRGRHSFPWIAPLILDPYLRILSDKQGDKKY